MTTQFDKELERILIDLRGWDIERPQAVEAIKKAVEVHIIGEDDPRPTNGSIGAASNPGTLESMFYTSRKDLRTQQTKHLYGEDK